MALNKVTYVDDTTVISAQNLNDIQDEIIAIENDMGDVAELNFTVVESF